MIEIIDGVTPQTEKAAFIAPTAVIVGDVRLERGVSVWYGAVLRSDDSPICIGEDSNIQDNATLHANGGCAIRIGREVSVGHNAIVHGATLGDRVIVGMHATVLDHAQVGSDCLIGAGAVVTEGMVIPDGSLVLGVPARVVRPLSSQQLALLRENAEEYRHLSALYTKD